MSDLIGTVSPLVHDKDGIEAGLVFAEAGVPVCYVTMPNLGTTAPATKAGAFVVGAAEIVGGGGPARARRPRRARARVDHADLRRPAHGAHHDHAARRPLPLPRDRAAARLRHPGARARWAAPTPRRPGTWLAGVETILQLLQVPLDGCELYTGIGLTNTYTPLHPREPHPRRRPLQPRPLRVPRHPHGRGVAGAGRHRRRRAGRPLPRAAAHAGAHARRGGARREPGDRRRTASTTATRWRWRASARSTSSRTTGRSPCRSRRRPSSGGSSTPRTGRPAARAAGALPGPEPRQAPVGSHPDRSPDDEEGRAPHPRRPALSTCPSCATSVSRRRRLEAGLPPRAAAALTRLQPRPLLEALDAVDRDVERLCDVELGLDHAGLAGSHRRGERQRAEPLLDADLLHGDRVATGRACVQPSLSATYCLGFLETHSSGSSACVPRDLPRSAFRPCPKPACGHTPCRGDRPYPPSSRRS